MKSLHVVLLCGVNVTNSWHNREHIVTIFNSFIHHSSSRIALTEKKKHRNLNKYGEINSRSPCQFSWANSIRKDAFSENIELFTESLRKLCSLSREEHKLAVANNTVIGRWQSFNESRKPPENINSTSCPLLCCSISLTSVNVRLCSHRSVSRHSR